MNKARIAVLVSGGGTNLQALIDAQAAGIIKSGEITLVISNKAGAYAAFQGLTIKSISYKNDAPGDDIYVDFTLGDATYSFCVERYLTGPETEVYKAFADLQVGNKVDIEGFLYWYEGVNTHITAVEKAA